ncbi:ceramide kinase [Ananas comosus]|uniref:Ceramide kinase n=1 Tax=Ananas comosus TaxID=4615 RepID=A0A6P5FS13_ANACO|nr:ceramide kinase [Ananas comosus]
MERDAPPLSSTLFMDGVGEVVLTLRPDGISWKPLDAGVVASSCLGMDFRSKIQTEIKFSDVYGVELIDSGLVHNGSWNIGTFRWGGDSEAHRFVVHGFLGERGSASPWVLVAYTFGHKYLKICQKWVEHIEACIKNEPARPRSLLVLVHPLCGKGKGRKSWDTVAPIFCRAKVQTKVTVTQRAGHAYNIVSSLSDRELRSFDGIVAVGGDGLFNEVLNGLLASRHEASYPPSPTELSFAGCGEQSQQCRDNTNGRCSSNDVNDMASETSLTSDDHEPLLTSSMPNGTDIPKSTTKNEECNAANQAPSTPFPNDWFRLGIIPAGSTDAIVLSTTGIRDPVTSALNIVLGRKMLLDIAQVVRWKASPSPRDLPSVHYAASFAGYGFYGDVIKESEKYRWMGPIRYDYAGTIVFLQHRSYEAEIAYLVEKADPVTIPTSMAETGTQPSQALQKSPSRLICCENCAVCAETATTANIYSESSRWVKSKGRFLSIGAAIMSCRNERAPDGLVADAHLADGFLHLILVRDCPRPYYLWHLTQLTKKGSDPLNFKFVEHHKTRAFTFISSQDESVWNLDGEMLKACRVSVQVFRGLINLFASGPVV